MNKIPLDLMKNLSIDQIIQLYNDGYTLEDSKIIHLQYLSPSIMFHVTCQSINCKDVHIIVNNTDQGVTDDTGTILLRGQSPEKTINFTATKLGYDDYTGSVTTGSKGDVTDVYIDLVPATKGTASLIFKVTEPGSSGQQPSYGAHIILDNQEFGITDKFGMLTVQNLAAETTIPFLISKAGFPEYFGIAKVGENGVPPTDINIDLQLFPTRTLSILRTALIGSLFLTSVGLIGGYIIKNISKDTNNNE